MVERTTQNSKTRPSVLNVGSAGEKTLAEQLAQLIENIKLVPNTTTRITPFETTAVENQTQNLQTHSHSLFKQAYDKIKTFDLEKKRRRTAMLRETTMWNQVSIQRPRLDIQYPTPSNLDSDSNAMPLSSKLIASALKRKNMSSGLQSVSHLIN